MILYKYMSFARKDFWNNYQLRFTQPSAFNDPFDSFISNSFLPNYLMPENAGFGDMAALFYGIENDMNKSNDDFAVFCMSDVWNSVLMWAHYADNHKGFVVGFDVTHPFFELEKAFGTRKVTYRKNRPQFSAADILNEMYYKADIWSYEHEWRLCKDAYKADVIIEGDENIYLFRLPKESIQSVFLGVFMPDSQKEWIYEMASKIGVQCYQVLRDYQNFELHAVEYDDFRLMKQQYVSTIKSTVKTESEHSALEKPQKTSELITNTLAKMAKILSHIITLTYQTYSNDINESNINAYCEAIKAFETPISEISYLPSEFKSCDNSISREDYENRVKHIKRNFDECTDAIYQLSSIMEQSSNGLLPCTKEYLSNQIEEKLGRAVSGFAQSTAWAAIFIDESSLKKIITNVTFDNDFQLMTADQKGWKLGQKIGQRWYSMKHAAIETANQIYLNQYRHTRIKWVRRKLYIFGIEHTEATNLNDIKVNTANYIKKAIENYIWTEGADYINEFRKDHNEEKIVEHMDKLSNDIISRLSEDYNKEKIAEIFDEYYVGCYDTEIEDYIKTYCQYNQGSSPELVHSDFGYMGTLTEAIRKRIREFCFFNDVVQANGGTLKTGDKNAEERRRNRIRTCMLHGGVQEKDVNLYIETLLPEV